MSSISSSIGAMPSLVDYLAKNGSSGTTKLGFTQYQGSGLASASSSIESSSGDIVSLSPEAQRILAQAQAAKTTPSSSDTKDETKSAAQQFVADFFNLNDVDISTISDDTMSLIKGLAAMIDDMTSPTQNSTLDKITNTYSKGARQSFTLEEQGHTISFMVQYKDGKPASLTVTNVTGANAETGVIKLTPDATGAASGVSVTSEKRTYNSFGQMTSAAAGDPLEFDLYAAS